MKMEYCKKKLGKKEISQTAVILKLLAQDCRLKILCILRNGEHCACEIIKIIDLPQNLVSHHLNKLKDAKMIKGRKKSVWIHYSLTKKGEKITENIFKIIK